MKRIGLFGSISRDSARKDSDFVNDYKTQYAIIRNLEIIGEASKQISSDLKGKYSIAAGELNR